jgi:alkylated DNA repair protein alkB family protein 1
MNLVRWSLRDQARQPNETNLDTHYILPQEGLWNAYLHSRSHIQEEPIFQPRKCTPSPRLVSQESSGPRKLINNTPATVENIALLSESPKPLPSPSPTVEPSTSSLLLQKLRWANIGWHYHWGSKQYDFLKGKGTVHAELRDLCQRAVAIVNWEEVFGLDDEAQWGDSGPAWRSWNETYGEFLLS